MRLRIIAIGRLKVGPERELVKKYQKRIRWPLSIEEIDARAVRSTAASTQKVAALIREALAHRRPGGRVLIALDENGHSWSSQEFSKRIIALRDQNVEELVFVIGGADGLDPGLLTKADVRLSLGRMTWPHALARVLLVEQIYRAQEIAAGHPYHRE